MTAAGKTTAVNIAKNPVPGGREAHNWSAVKNTVPLKIVPAAVKITAFTINGKSFLIARKSAKMTADVISLSMTFGKKPPGIVDVKPDNRPAARPITAILRRSANRKIVRNMVDSNKSGFMPKKNPGTTASNTVPIAKNNAMKTSFFTCFTLISPQLVSFSPDNALPLIAGITSSIPNDGKKGNTIQSFMPDASSGTG